MIRLSIVLLNAFVVAALVASPASLAAQEKKTLSDSLKGGLDKLIGQKEKEPPPERLDNSLSLSSPAKPSVGVYVAVARLYEQHGKWDLAEQQYVQALRAQPNDMAALLGYAGLKEKIAKPDEAQLLYQKAVAQFPNEPAVHNNLGLYLARRNQHAESARALARAVALQPQNLLYRNNLATVLVEMNRIVEAYAHLKAAHGEAGAYYNLGYLLQKKGNTQEAISYFAAALRADPSMAPAQQWLAKLQDAQSLPQYAGQGRADAPVEGPSSAIAGPTAAMARASQHASDREYSSDVASTPPPAQGSWGVPVHAADAGRQPMATSVQPANAPPAPLPPGSHFPSMSAVAPAQPEQRPVGDGPTHLDRPAVGDTLPARTPLRLSPRTATELAPLPPARSQSAQMAPSIQHAAEPAARGAVPAMGDGLPSAPLPPSDPSRMQRLPLVR